MTILKKLFRYAPVTFTYDELRSEQYLRMTTQEAIEHKCRENHVTHAIVDSRTFDHLINHFDLLSQARIGDRTLQPDGKTRIVWGRFIVDCVPLLDKREPKNEGDQ